MFRNNACFAFQQGKKHATFMPVAAVSITSSCHNLSWAYNYPPVLTTLVYISTLHRWFTYVHLFKTHLTGFSLPFPLSLTTNTLNKCRIGWFDSSIWLPKPRGLPSSLLQQERLTPFVMTHNCSVGLSGPR